jgi:hypothetical protein
VKSGDLSLRIRLRKRDYLHREEEAFNEMIQALAENWATVQVAGLDVLRDLGELEQALSETTGRQSEYQHLLTTHRQHLEHLVEAAEGFRVHPVQEDAGAPAA